MAFTYYSPCPVDHTKCGSTDTSNFTVLVSFSGTRFKTIANGGHVTSSSGYDIRPYADTGHSSAYSYQLEPLSYDPVAGTGRLWVKVPTLSHTADTPIYLFYGDATLTTDGSSTAAWDSSFLEVQHFGDGATLTTTDSTSNANNGTLSPGGGFPSATTGKVGGGALFTSAHSSYIGLGNPASLQVTGNLSLAVWANSTGSAGQMVSKDKDTGGRAFAFDVTSNYRFYINGGGGSDLVASASAAGGSVYKRIVGTYSTAGVLKIYINGAIDGTQSGASTSIPSATANVRIGAREYTGFEGYFDGSLDEVYIVGATLSADWVLSDYNNQSSPSTFAVLGTEVAVTSAYKVERHVFERGINRGNLRGLV